MPTEIEEALAKQEQEHRLKAVEDAVAKMAKERDKAVIWGLGIVGTVFVWMAAFIWKYITEHLTK